MKYNTDTLWTYNTSWPSQGQDSDINFLYLKKYQSININQNQSIMTIQLPTCDAQ